MMSDVRGVTEVNEAQGFKYFVYDEQRALDCNRLFDVYGPYDRRLYARVATTGRAGVARAVDAAVTAFHAWPQSTAMRTRLFFKAGGGPQ
jgi:acyl-CoA reductase-like NAD-dependent aldehyde dehydrogenase